MSELLTSEPTEQGVVTLTLDRPTKRNALSTSLRDEVSDALDALADDERVRCVVLTGSGEVFSAGFDLAEFQVDDPAFQERLWASSDRFHRRVLTFPLPIIAAVNGPAIAGGFDLAVMCDIRIAADTARFSHPERTFSEVVYSPLRELVGGGVARELALTGRVVLAEEARRLGLVAAVVPAGDVVAEAVSMAATVCEAPRDVLLRMKAKILARAGIDAGSPTLAL